MFFAFLLITIFSRIQTFKHPRLPDKTPNTHHVIHVCKDAPVCSFLKRFCNQPPERPPLVTPFKKICGNGNLCKQNSHTCPVLCGQCRSSRNPRSLNTCDLETKRLTQVQNDNFFSDIAHFSFSLLQQTTKLRGGCQDTKKYCTNLVGNDCETPMISKNCKKTCGKCGNAENVFFSPISIALALGMLEIGTAGNTKQQVDNALLRDTSQEHPNTKLIGALFSNLTSELNGNGQDFILSTANRLFLAKDYEIKNAFLEVVKNCFQSTVANKDFQSKAEIVRNQINEWVETKTNEKIKDLLPPGSLDADTKLVIVNAIYFKSAWKFSFDSDKTIQKANFYLSNGDIKTVKMMSHARGISVRYYEQKEFRAIQLPYKAKDLAMLIVLPEPKVDLDFFDVNHYNHIINRFWWLKLIVQLPKFRLDSELPLKNVLKQLGMADMFGSKADLSNLADGPLYVADAFHKAFVEVNEEGSEAAAATAFSLRKRSLQLSKPPTFRVDRPFLFVLIKKNIPLFIGKFVSPP